MKLHIKTTLILIFGISLIITFIYYPAQTALGILIGRVLDIAYSVIYSILKDNQEKFNDGGIK
jgi:uncharacterized membrane protein